MPGGAGPGVRLHLRPDLFGGGLKYHLPSLIKPDLGKFREVKCTFNVNARAVTVVVDGIPLTRPAGPLPTRVFFGLELESPTRAKIKDLELIQFRPRKLR